MEKQVEKLLKSADDGVHVLFSQYMVVVLPFRDVLPEISFIA